MESKYIFPMSRVDFRIANEKDLPTIMTLLATDVVSRIPTDLSSLEPLSVFREIHADPNNEILVGTRDDRVIACLQATYIPCLTLFCAKRLLIEGVRVDPSFRGQGIGKKMFEAAIARGKDRGCKIVQLTTNNSRTDALSFYKALGFEATHQGFKLHI